MRPSDASTDASIVEAVAVELSSLMRDETHLSVNKSVSKMSPSCVMKLKNSVTVFGALDEGVKYAITPQLDILKAKNYSMRMSTLEY